MKNIKKSAKRFLQVSCTLTLTSLLASACTDNEVNKAQTTKSASVNNQQNNDNLSATKTDKLTATNAKGGDSEKSNNPPSKGEKNHDQVTNVDHDKSSSHVNNSMSKKDEEKSTATANTQSTTQASAEQGNTTHPPSGDNKTHNDGSTNSSVHNTENPPQPKP